MSLAYLSFSYSTILLKTTDRQKREESLGRNMVAKQCVTQSVSRLARSLVCGIYDKRFLLYYVETKGNQALSGLNLSIVGLKYQIQIELFLKKNECSTFQPVQQTQSQIVLGVEQLSLHGSGRNCGRGLEKVWFWFR